MRGLNRIAVIAGAMAILPGSLLARGPAKVFGCHRIGVRRAQKGYLPHRPAIFGAARPTSASAHTMPGNVQASPPSPDDHKSWTTTDPWFSPRPEGGEAEEWEELPRDRIIPVADDQAVVTERLLSQTPIVEVDDATASRFTGTKLRSPVGMRPYLVRGLYLNRWTGGFFVQVDSKGERLDVIHASLGRFAVPMKRLPLIIVVPTKPQTVYVQVRMAE